MMPISKFIACVRCVIYVVISTVAGCQLLAPHPKSSLNLADYAFFDPNQDPNGDQTGTDVVVDQLKGVYVDNLKESPVVVGGGDWFGADLAVRGMEFVPLGYTLIGLGVTFFELDDSLELQDPLVMWVHTPPEYDNNFDPDPIVRAKVTVRNDVCEFVACHASGIVYYALFQNPKNGHLAVSEGVLGKVILRCDACLTGNCIDIFSDHGGDVKCQDCKNADLYDGPCARACHHFVKCDIEKPPLCCDYIDDDYRLMNPPQCLVDTDADTEVLFLALLGIHEGSVPCEDAKDQCSLALTTVTNGTCSVPTN